MLTATPILFARTRWVIGLVFMGVVSFCGSWILPVDLVDNPFDHMRSQVVVDLVPLLACLVWSFMAYSPLPEMERSAAGSVLLRLRLAWWTLAAVIIISAGNLAYCFRDVSGWFMVSHMRNALFGLAIATLCTLVLPQAASWIPLSLYTGVCWIAGTLDESGTPRFWALPSYMADSWVAAVVTAVLAITSVGLYCVFERGRNR